MYPFGMGLPVPVSPGLQVQVAFASIMLQTALSTHAVGDVYAVRVTTQFVLALASDAVRSVERVSTDQSSLMPAMTKSVCFGAAAQSCAPLNVQPAGQSAGRPPLPSAHVAVPVQAPAVPVHPGGHSPAAAAHTVPGSIQVAKGLASAS